MTEPVDDSLHVGAGGDGDTEAVPDGVTDGETPQTGDIVIDSALSELAAVEPDDLDGQLAAGETLHRTLQARLSDLGT